MSLFSAGELTILNCSELDPMTGRQENDQLYLPNVTRPSSNVLLHFVSYNLIPYQSAVNKKLRVLSLACNHIQLKLSARWLPCLSDSVIPGKGEGKVCLFMSTKSLATVQQHEKEDTPFPFAAVKERQSIVPFCLPSGVPRKLKTLLRRWTKP